MRILVNNNMATANQSNNCSVFWDIENVGVPKSMRPREFVEMVRKSVLTPNDLVVDEFFCVCDTVKIGLKSQEFLESLNRAGVTTVHISSTSKNAADEKIIDLMCKYVDKGGGSVVLIAGDVNYVNHLRRFQAKGVRNYLICSTLQSASKDLINSAHKSWILDRRANEPKLKPFAASDSHVLKNTPRNGPCFVKVYGFPQHLDKRPLNQFKQLLSAGGGKIRTDINDGGFVWLSFKCPEDARRTAIRLNGWRFGDRLLQAQYVENPPFHFNYNQGPRRDFDMPSASSYERRGMSSGVRDGIQNLSIHKSGDELSSSSRDINVEVCFQNYDRDAMEHFVKKMLPGFNGSFIRSDASRFLVNFNSERDATKFIVEINSLAEGSTKATVRAKIVPTSSRQDSSSSDDDVVYVCSKEGTSRASSPRKEDHNRLYLSLEYKRRPDQALVDQLGRNGIKLLHEADKCMWFRVGDPLKGQKVMEKLNFHGFLSILTERLPDDVKSKLRAVKVWRLRSCQDSQFQTGETTDSKVATESDYSLLAVHNLPSGLDAKSVWQLLQSFVQPHKGELIGYVKEVAYLKFPSTALLQRAFINLRGILVDGTEIVPDIVTKYPSKLKCR